jgi:hypothetical protein
MAKVIDAHCETTRLMKKKTQMPCRGYRLIATKLHTSKPKAQGGFGVCHIFALGMKECGVRWKI